MMKKRYNSSMVGPTTQEDDDENVNNTNNNTNNINNNRHNNNNNIKNNPLQQKSFDLNTFLQSPKSKSTSLSPLHVTKTATSYMDESEVIQFIGTAHSRKGKYIRKTWKQTCIKLRKSRRFKYYMYVFVTLCLCWVVYHQDNNNNHNHNNLSSSSSVLSDGKHNENENWNGNEEKQHDNMNNNQNDTAKGKTHDNNNYDNNNENGRYDNNNQYIQYLMKTNDIQMQDYTNIHSNILHSTHAQTSLLKKVSNQCLRHHQQEKQQDQDQEVKQQSQSLFSQEWKNIGQGGGIGGIGESKNNNIICNPKCPIENPFIGEDKSHFDSWRKASDMNIKLIDDYMNSFYHNDDDDDDGVNNSGGKKKRNTANIIHEKEIGYDVNHNNNMLDVVFYGDSIIEEWNGRWMGRNIKSKQGIQSVFQKYFNQTNTHSNANNDNNSNNNNSNDNDVDTLRGLALGIAGDKTTNLLYRIQNGGELPPDLQSNVFWLLIGVNDLRSNCSEDMVVLGILAIVKELREKRPNSIIVVNGLLPMTDDIDGRLISTSTGRSNGSSNGNDSSGNGSGSGSGNSGDSYDYGLDDHDRDSQNSKESLEAKLFSSPSSPSSSSSSSSSPPPSSKKSTYHGNRRQSNDDERSNSNNSNNNNNNKNVIFNYWPSIEAINYQLQQYANNNEKVEYYDPSYIFIGQLGNHYMKQKELYVMKELQDDYLHPTSFGHEIWAESIIDYFVSDLDTPDNL